jgi:hypothetical protein
MSQAPAVTRSPGSRPGVPGWLPLYWQVITRHRPGGLEARSFTWLPGHGRRPALRIDGDSHRPLGLVPQGKHPVVNVRRFCQGLGGISSGAYDQCRCEFVLIAARVLHWVTWVCRELRPAAGALLPAVG